MLLLNILEQIQYANVTIQLNLPYVIYIYIYILKTTLILQNIGN